MILERVADGERSHRACRRHRRCRPARPALSWRGGVRRCRRRHGRRVLLPDGVAAWVGVGVGAGVAVWVGVGDTRTPEGMSRSRQARKPRRPTIIAIPEALSPARSAVRGATSRSGAAGPTMRMPAVGRRTYCTGVLVERRHADSPGCRRPPRAPAPARPRSGTASSDHASTRARTIASNPAGRWGSRWRAPGIGEAHTLSKKSPTTSPSNGSRPVIAAKVHAPRDQRSVSGPGAPPDGELLRAP